VGATVGNLPFLRVMSTGSTTLFLTCLAVVLYMTGVIWMVQGVHYPLFAQVGRDTFLTYHRLHSQYMTGVVLLPMVVELGTAGILALHPPTGLNRPFLIIGFLLTLLTWGVTALVSVPAHQQLSDGFDEGAHRTLVLSNWLRTLCWTAHSVLLLEQLRRLLLK